MYLCILTALLAENSVRVPPRVCTMAGMHFKDRVLEAAKYGITSAVANLTGCAPHPAASAQGKARQDASAHEMDVASWNMDRGATNGVKADGTPSHRKYDDTRKDLQTLLKKSSKRCIGCVQECGGAWTDAVEGILDRSGYKLLRGGRCN
jgi:hypothetical protein